MAQPAAPPQRSSLVRCIGLILVALVILVGLIVIITWLAVQPKKLRYSIEEGSISGYNLTKSNHLNATFHLVLRATNPSHQMSLYYDRITVTASFEDQKLSILNVSPFYQGRTNVTHLDLQLAAEGVALYGAVAGDLRMEQAAGYVDIDVEFRAKIRLKFGVFKVHRKLRVLCGSVTVPLGKKPMGFERVWCDVDRY
ncbi:NDR1/HIN1-like protein 10 [Andrographis paniculata]|uniref:NDR1/HIN1-like protein 10 n=1 Tax=Andrographis paniculata TaxID=175694 RepID=UPI0021E904D8|nr:NDR1/HIN1-like protein 10 [Andrographis paniculata]